MANQIKSDNKIINSPSNTVIIPERILDKRVDTFLSDLFNLRSIYKA